MHESLIASQSDMIMVFFIVYPNKADLQMCNVLLWPPYYPASTSAHVLFLFSAVWATTTPQFWIFYFYLWPYLYFKVTAISCVPKNRPHVYTGGTDA